MTYNIHSCVNNIGRENPYGISQVIAAAAPDIVALQEVESLTPDLHPDCPNQAEWFGQQLDMHYCFHGLRTGRHGKFGLALLSKRPPVLIKAGLLPAAASKKVMESRGAIWVQIQTDQGPVHVVNTHLGLRRLDRELQIETLLGPKWLGRLPSSEALVICGDLNAIPGSAVYQSLANKFSDVQRQARQRHLPRATFHAFYPLLRLDHIFISRALSTKAVRVPTGIRTRMASDHLPVLAQLERN